MTSTPGVARQITANKEAGHPTAGPLTTTSDFEEPLSLVEKALGLKVITRLVRLPASFVQIRNPLIFRSRELRRLQGIVEGSGVQKLAWHQQGFGRKLR